MRTRIITAVGCALLAMHVPLHAAEPVGTAWTYQGQLKQGDTPVNDTCDFTFRLWDDPLVGSELPTSPLGPVSIEVVNGLFSVELDFGANALGHGGRWLGIEVSCPPGGPLTPLSPRQPVAPAPYALQTRGLFVDDAGHVIVGSGTGQVTAGEPVPPQLTVLGETGLRGPLDVKGNVDVTGRVRVHATAAEGATSGAPPALHIDGNAVSSFLGPLYLNFGNQNPTRINDTLHVHADGRVGIGTPSPGNSLHVRKGTAGSINPHANAPLVVENSSHAYLNFLTPDANEKGILFGGPANNAAGGVIYNSAGTPDGLQFRTAGNQTRMSIDASGNVGLGTLLPGANLHIRAPGGAVLGEIIVTPGTSDADAQVRLTENTSATLGAIMKYDGTANQWQVRGLNADGETGPHLVVRRDDGRVGIGTSSPADALHVAGGVRVEGVSGLQVRNPVNTGAYVGLGWLNNVARLRIGGNGAGASSGMDLQGTGDTSLLRVLNNGDVGLGTVAPTGRLHLVGPSPDITLKMKAGGSWTAGFRMADTSVFSIFNGSGEAERLSVTSGGNVGIGTTSPTQRLEVNGNIRVTGGVQRPATGSTSLVPICFGALNINGTVVNGSGNFTASRVALGRYEIAIEGESFIFSSYTAIVSVSGFDGDTIGWGSTAGRLLVNTFDSSGNAVNAGFSFVVYKP